MVKSRVKRKLLDKRQEYCTGATGIPFTNTGSCVRACTVNFAVCWSAIPSSKSSINHDLAMEKMKLNGRILCIIIPASIAASEYRCNHPCDQPPPPCPPHPSFNTHNDISRLHINTSARERFDDLTAHNSAA